MSDPPPPPQHSSNSRKRGYDHHEFDEYRRSSIDGQVGTGGGGHSINNSSKGSRNPYDSSPPLKMHKELPPRLLPQHRQHQQQQQSLPQQREQQQKKQQAQQQEEDSVSDSDSYINSGDDYADNNNDEQTPSYPPQSSAYYQTNDNDNNNGHFILRETSGADLRRSQSRSGMVQAISTINSGPVSSTPPPPLHSSHRQEESWHRALWDKKGHRPREEAKRAGFRQWKEWCLEEGHKDYNVSVSRLLDYVETVLLPFDRLQAFQNRNATTAAGSHEFVFSSLETSILPILKYGQHHRETQSKNSKRNVGGSREMFRYDSLERGIAGGNRQDSSVWENTARQSAISNREGTRRSDSWEDDRLSSRRDGGDLTQSDERANDHHNNLERTQTRHEDRVDTRYKSRGRDQERRRGATHDDWQGHRRIRSASVLKPDQESDSQVDSRPLSSWEAAYHQGLEEGRRSSREVLPYSDERKDTRANSREDPGFDSRQVQRQDRRSSLRDDARAPSRQGGHRSDPRYDDSDDAPHGGRQDLPLLERYSGLAGLRPSSRASPRREYPLDPLEPVRKSASQEQQSSSRQEDAQVQMRLSHQDDQEDQWKSGRQKARQEDHQDSRDVCLPKEANSPVLPSKLLYGEVKLSRSNSKVYGTHGMDEDDFPPAFEGNDRADDVQDLADDSDYDEPEESLMSKLTRRRRLSQHNFTSATPSGSSLSIPVSTAITASTTASTANPACGENVVYVSTKDSSPAYSFTLGRYKANEFIIHSPQHKDGPFTNKTRPIPESCHNVIDVLEVWRYGKKPFTAIQDLSEKYGRSWIAQNDKERHHFFTEVVQEFRRLVLDQGMHDDMAVKELMGRQEWWLIPLSNPPQADEAGELSSEGEPMDTDSNSDYVFRSSYQRKSSESRKSSRSLKRSESSKRSQSRKRSESRKASQSHKKSPAISTDMDMDMDMDISTAEANRTTAADHSASSDEDAEPMDFEAFDASIARPVSRNSHRHPRPQYKDNFVEPWGDAPINYSFTFPIPDGIETVPEIYQAWYYGWKDLPALLQLTKDNGPSWRSSLLPSSKKVYDWYHVHYKVVRAIDDQVAMEPSEWTVEDAILSLEQLRGKKKLSNLHKDIPRPGHMIKPIKSKDIGTPKGHAEDGSPAAYDDIKPTTSNSKAPPTDNSTLTAGDSPPNSSITGSSESLITDQSAGIIATNVSSSSKTSATSQPRLTTDNNTPTTIKDKPLPTSPRNSIGAFVEKKFKFFRNNALGAKGKTTGSAKTSSTDNTTANRRKSTTDITSSTSSAKDRMATSTPTRTIDDIADSISKLIDEGTNATTASIARLTTESNSVPMTKESTAAGSMTKIAESTIIGGPKSTVDNGDAPGAMDGITTSVLMNAVNNSDVASKSTPAAEINNASVDKDKTSDISVASTVNDTTASTPPTSMAKSIPLSTKDWTVSMDDAVVNNSDVSKAKLAVDSSSVSITKVRSSSVAASTSATKNVAVSRSISSGSSYTFIHKSTFQRAMSNTQIGSRTSKEQPKGLIQSGSAPTSSSGTPISRSSFDEDAVMSSSARTGDNRPSGMPTSNSNNSTTALNGMNTGNANCLLNDVTAGAVNRPNTVSVSSDVKNVPSGMIAGTARPLNSVSAHDLARPRHGLGYTVAPQEYAQRSKEQVESLHRRSRSGTEVLESGQVNSIHHTLSHQGSASSRVAVPLPPGLQFLKAPHPTSSSSSSVSCPQDERVMHLEGREQGYDDEKQQPAHHRPALHRSAPPLPQAPLRPPSLQQQHTQSPRLPHQPHHNPTPSQRQQQPSKHESYYKQQVQLNQQKQQHHQQSQRRDSRSSDNARTHHTGTRLHSHPSSSASSHNYERNWNGRHWSSSAANDKVIDLT